MASWNEKLNQMTQSAISKSKEVAGVTKLTLENSSRNQDIKIIYTKVGEYVMENGLLSEDPTVAQWAAQVAGFKAEIEANNEKINELKNVNVCPKCGTALPKTSKFCDQCGAEITVESPEGSDAEETEEIIIDSTYSETEEDTKDE